MSRTLTIFLIAVLLLGTGLWVSGLVPHCCGARQAPSWMEAVLARNFRALSLPSGARRARTLSPVLPSFCRKHLAISPITAPLVMIMTEAVTLTWAAICILALLTCGLPLRSN